MIAELAAEEDSVTPTEEAVVPEELAEEEPGAEAEPETEAEAEEAVATDGQEATADPVSETPDSLAPADIPVLPIAPQADNTINLCEVKYSENLYSLDKEEYMKIQNRISVFKEATNTRSNIIPTMITTFGMKEGTYSDQIIAKIDMEDIF